MEKEKINKNLTCALTIMLDQTTYNKIEEEVAEENLSKGYVVRKALKQYFKNQEKTK